MTRAAVPFVKGHGTGNDFVLLPESDGTTVTPSIVRALCDRHLGLGADGVLVVARTEGAPEVAGQAGVAPWFMDYRNADGSVSEMCGNGARVFAAHLLAAGLAPPGAFSIATRGGARGVVVDEGVVGIDMGHAQFLDRHDLRVTVAEPGPRVAGAPALGVLLPNPHAVTWVADLALAGTLSSAPAVTPEGAFPDGVNVEFVRVLAEDHIEMRVFERGVGQTLSCGTGACAAVVATIRRDGGAPDGQRVRVDVPGGTLMVTWQSDGSVHLQGPTQVVARGTLEPEWWEAHV